MKYTHYYTPEEFCRENGYSHLVGPCEELAISILEAAGYEVSYAVEDGSPNYFWSSLVAKRDGALVCWISLEPASSWAKAA